MPLQKTVVGLPLARGVETKSDSKMLQPGTNTTFENCTLSTIERASKRNGYTALPTSIVAGGNLTTGDSLLSFKNELLQGAGPALYSYSPGDAAWVSKGFIVPLAVTGKSIMRGTSAQTMADSGTTSGLTCYAWEDSRGGIRASVVDDSTGVVLLADTSINSSGVQARVLAFPTALMVLYRVAGNLRCRIYSVALNAFASEVVTTTDLDNGQGRWDATPAGNNFIVAYCTTAGAGVKVAYILNTGSFAGAGSGFPAAVTPAAENASNAVCVNYDAASGLTYVVYSTATPSMRGFVLNGDFSTKVAAKAIDATATAVRNITGVVDPTTTNQILYFYEFSTAQTYNAITWSVTFTSTGTVGTPAVLKRSVGLASKSWIQSGKVYACFAYSSVLSSTYFVMDSAGNVAGRMLPTRGGGLTAKQCGLPFMRSYASSVWKVPLLARVRLTSANNNVFYDTGVFESSLDFGARGNQQHAQLGDNLHIVGGCLYDYDGYGAIEHGFHYPPENVSNSNGAGGSVDAGVHQYCAVYEWADAQGQIHQSSPSVALSVTVVGGTQTITITVPTLRVTAKTSPRNEVNIVIYRTAAALTTFYRLTSIASPLANTTSADSVNYVDTAADSTITANAQLYTAGGVFGNDPPPACTLIAVGKNRLWVNDAEQNNVLAYSQDRVPDQGVAFSQFLTITMPVLNDSPGQMTALGVMDDKVIIFKAASIYAFAGDGPTAAGLNNFYTKPQVISTDVGCTQPNSIVLMPDGLIFFSAKGWYLLNRSLQTSYIGANVEGFNDQTYVSANLVPYANQTRFLTSTSQGSTTVYDHYMNQWSTFANHVGLDSEVVGGSYYYLRSNGIVFQESTSSFLDNGSYIPLRIRTGWISFAQINGFQRIYRAMVLGSYITGHQLTVRVAYDFAGGDNPIFTDSFSIDASGTINQTAWGSDSVWGNSSPWGGMGDNVEQFEVLFNRQKCSAILFEISDSEQGTPAEGVNLSALSLLVGVKKGMQKGPVSRRLTN